MVLLHDADPVYAMLLRQYIDVVNEALLTSRMRFPYKQIWDAVALEELKLKICATLVDAQAVVSATIVLRNGELGLMPEICCGCAKCYGDERHLTLTRDGVDLVVNHRQLFIAQPARLDWDWLTPEMGYLSEQGKPELQAAQAYSDNCLDERA